MSIEKNIQTVKDFFAAIGRGDREALLALVAEDIEWIIPGEDWPLAGTRHGHAGLADLLETASKSIETSTEPREFVAQGDRVLLVGFARGKNDEPGWSAGFLFVFQLQGAAGEERNKVSSQVGAYLCPIDFWHLVLGGSQAVNEFALIGE